MSDTTTYVSSSHTAVFKAVLDLPAHLNTNAVQSRALLHKLGMRILAFISNSFIIKSKGGTDETGDRWAPLLASTIRRRRNARSRAQGKMTEEWRKHYQRGLVIFKGDKASAARRAWVIIKRNPRYVTHASAAHVTMGGSVDILNDTGLLLRSLSPDGTSAERIFRVTADSVTIGTTRQGASAHHRGVPGRLPQRRLWPDPVKWPASWRRALMKIAVDGVKDIIIDLVKRAH